MARNSILPLNPYTPRKVKNETDYYKSLPYKIIFYSPQAERVGNIKRQPYTPHSAFSARAASINGSKTAINSPVFL
jgi:hypothetical protein